MRKVMTIVGTRPEIIKMSRVIAAFDQHTDHILVHTGQNYDYELNEIFFNELMIRRPDYFLEAAGKNAAETIARVIERTDALFDSVKPEALLLYGDTNSCLSVIAAKRRRIPVFHMEAGNRCFDQRVPEEINRKVVDHLSDVNFALTEHARRHLLAEGLPSDRIFVSGSHMEEVLDYYASRIATSTILSQLGLEAHGYLIASAHREENVDSDARLFALLSSFRQLHQELKVPVIVSTHPRTRKRLAAMGETLDGEIRFLPPFGFCDYIALQKHALCVVSDSGTITEESSLLNFPAVNLREAHERPEGVDEGTLIMSDCSPVRLTEAVQTTIAISRTAPSYRRVVADYKGGAVSLKILTTVLSYIDYVNRVVWRESANFSPNDVSLSQAHGAKGQ
ncbi:UDP-N-acetylglucosamine 2-epimerase (non-hydrolyzing) [Rhizobium sp. LjRoot98]|uniref:non-hydrolyzing UDP-N-acetylglucosamine 2-epimerase n=1 Tax=Rhizobium sp. LjRoot98 TaxID=3342345 RepID=UPI003ECC952C